MQALLNAVQAGSVGQDHIFADGVIFNRKPRFWFAFYLSFWHAGAVTLEAAKCALVMPFFFSSS